MNHKELQSLVSSYLDGELIEKDKAIVLSHLGKCSDCRKFIEHSNYLRDEIKSLGEVKLSDYFAMRVSHIIEKRDEQFEDWLGVEPLARNSFLILAIIVVVMFFFTNSESNSSAFASDQMLMGTSNDSISAQILMQKEDISNNDLLYAVMER
jgi:predicted anti-sigma-YlaC factor YlaD